MKAGHEVNFFSSPSAAENAAAQGLNVLRLSGDIKATLPLDHPERPLTRADVLRASRAGIQLVNDNTQNWMKSIAERAHESDALLIAGLACPAARATAIALGKPHIELWLQPTTQTSSFAAPTVPLHKLPGFVNRLTYRVGPGAMIDRFFGKAAHRGQRTIFGRNFKASAAVSRLYGFSEHLVPRPVDWNSSNHVCGSWSQPIGQWKPPTALLEYLNAGEPPVYVGFGAVSFFIRKPLLDVLAQALSGRRVVFYRGWSEVTRDMLPDNFYVIDDVPHAWLFPKMSVVIHHAGAGTAHTVAAAGVPSVAFPVGTDQPFWAHRLHLTGAAPKPLSALKMTVSQVVESIHTAEGAACKKSAAVLAAKISSDRGIEKAVELISK